MVILLPECGVLLESVVLTFSVRLRKTFGMGGLTREPPSWMDQATVSTVDWSWQSQCVEAIQLPRRMTWSVAGPGIAEGGSIAVACLQLYVLTSTPLTAGGRLAKRAFPRFTERRRDW